MTAALFFFYTCSAIMLASAFMVVAARNPVHSVLFLILAFVNAAGLFILIGAEYLGMLLIVVYVGAVMVLFLFVVMMLDVDFAEFKSGFFQVLPVGVVIGVIVAIELTLVAGAWITAPTVKPGAPATASLSNIAAIGQVLYTQYIYFFQAAGLILLTAMIGAIVLTLRHKPDVRRQSIPDQNARNRHNAVEIKKTPSRAGV